MRYDKETIDRADEDELCCDICAYRFECPAVRSYKKGSCENGYPLWASSLLRSRWLPRKRRMKEIVQ